MSILGPIVLIAVIAGAALTGALLSCRRDGVPFFSREAWRW